MTRFDANNSFLRQIRASHSRRMRLMQQATDRERILQGRLSKAGVSADDPDAYELAVRFLFKDSPLCNAKIEFTDDRLWIGDGERGNGSKHQAGFGLDAMYACVNAWEGDHLWDPEHPDPNVIISVRDWLDPVDRWSWDVRRTGSVPLGQPSFW